MVTRRNLDIQKAVGYNLLKQSAIRKERKLLHSYTRLAVIEDRLILPRWRRSWFGCKVAEGNYNLGTPVTSGQLFVLLSFNS